MTNTLGWWLDIYPVSIAIARPAATCSRHGTAERAIRKSCQPHKHAGTGTETDIRTRWRHESPTKVCNHHVRIAHGLSNIDILAYNYQANTRSSYPKPKPGLIRESLADNPLTDLPQLLCVSFVSRIGVNFIWWCKLTVEQK